MRTTSARGGSPSIEVPGYWWYQARSRLLEESLGPFVPAGGRVLDVGSADGPSAAWFRERAIETAALDVDPRGLGANGICGSATSLPFAGESFDVVAAFDVVEHCEPESSALHELRRVLRPGGALVLSVPAYQWAWTDHDAANGHYRRYTRDRIVDAVTAAGLTVARATYAFTAVFPMFVLERMVRKARYRGQEIGPADIVTVPALPRPVHHALLGLCRLEERAVRSRDLPFGSSIFVAAHR